METTISELTALTTRDGKMSAANIFVMRYLFSLCILIRLEM